MRGLAASLVFALLAVLIGYGYRDDLQRVLIDKYPSLETWSIPFVGKSVPECACEGNEAEDEGVGSCRLRGTVNDCCCDYESVNKLNRDHLHPVVSKLVKTSYFKYFKVNLNCDCPLWPDEGMCVKEACSVCECEAVEIPSVWKDEESKHPAGCNASTIEQEFMVNRTVDPNIKAVLVNLPGWTGFSNPWMAEDEKDTEYSYINLLDNPERYTGYKQGNNAQQVWSSIYSQSCFAGSSNPGEDTCMEKRVFYRLISGLHSSITAHIAWDYLIDEERNIWGPNLDLFEARLGHPSLKSRVENLYFAFSFVLRAVMKTGPFLDKIEYKSGQPEEESHTKALMHMLVNHPMLQAACPIPFDEGRMWKGDEGPQLKSQLQSSFRNITRIMDCVGCEKCKLWGKLQTLGIASALKILFHESDCSKETGTDSPAPLILERNEVIALINLLERLSKSVETYREMSMMLEKAKKQAAKTAST